ncbi:MAG TPA: serine hydrolase domain-containing protein [Vicinamibacterales bacterium]|nr:serine hydrolase domain-containing protein [Vicinamibacterales bacterium]
MRVAFILAALLAATPALAQNQDKTAEVDKIFSWVKLGMPGCVAAASQDGKLVVNRAYGLADLERNVPLTTESLLDAGSIRKQFVAAAILLLVEEGKLSLSDDIRKHIPELHDFGHTITIDHLLTHTSGIRDWVPLLNWASGDPDVMSLLLRQRTLNFVPGTEWSYSNSGYVLLPEIVARTSGKKFSEFLHTRVLDPLGMKNSRYVDDPDIVIRNRALAYEPQGSPSGGAWRMDMRLGNERGGAGALFTTAADLVLWNDALASARLGKFVTESIQAPATLSNGRKLTYARGISLLTESAGRMLLHGGGAAAYRSIAAHFLDHGISVAVLCNAGEASDARDDFAAGIVDLILADKGFKRAPSTPPPAGITGVDVSGRAGLFFNERTNEPMRVVANNGRLAIAGGRPLVTLAAERFRVARPSTNFMSNDDFELRFLSNDQFELKSMEGVTTHYRRARPFAPSADDLKAFAGRYESDELSAFLDLTPGRQGLAARLNDARPLGLEFRPVDRDTFQFGNFTMRFVRDNAGKVVALDMNSPVFRSVRFTRR